MLFLTFVKTWTISSSARIPHPFRGGRVVEEKDCIYAAGLIDGEGTITLSRLHASCRFRAPVVSVSSTTRQLLEFLQVTFGGAICTHKTYKAHHKPHWSWRVARNDAINFLRNVSPHLKEPEKRRRAELLVHVYPKLTPRNGRYSETGLHQKIAFEDTFFHPSGPSPAATGPYESLHG